MTYLFVPKVPKVYDSASLNLPSCGGSALDLHLLYNYIITKGRTITAMQPPGLSSPSYSVNSTDYLRWASMGQPSTNELCTS